MPIRPFPYQLGIGIDIIHINRVLAILRKGDGGSQQLDRYIRRFLTAHERHEFMNQYGAWYTTGQKELEIIARHLAGRYVLFA